MVDLDTQGTLIPERLATLIVPGEPIKPNTFLRSNFIARNNTTIMTPAHVLLGEALFSTQLFDPETERTPLEVYLKDEGANYDAHTALEEARYALAKETLKRIPANSQLSYTMDGLRQLMEERYNGEFDDLVDTAERLGGFVVMHAVDLLSGEERKHCRLPTASYVGII